MTPQRAQELEAELRRLADMHNQGALEGIDKGYIAAAQSDRIYAIVYTKAADLVRDAARGE